MALSPEIEKNLQEVQAIFMEFRPKALKKQLSKEESEIKSMKDDVSQILKKGPKEPIFDENSAAKEMISTVLYTVVKRRMIIAAHLVINAYRVMVSNLAVNSVLDKDLAEYIETSLADLLLCLQEISESLEKEVHNFKGHELFNQLQIMIASLHETITNCEEYASKIKGKDWNAKESLTKAKREYKAHRYNVYSALNFFKDQYLNAHFSDMIHKADAQIGHVRF